MNNKFYYTCFENHTGDEDLTLAKDKNLDIINQIQFLMITDTENDTHKLISLYDNANTEERAYLDYLMVAICGYTLSSVIELADKNKLYLDDVETETFSEPLKEKSEAAKQCEEKPDLNIKWMSQEKDKQTMSDAEYQQKLKRMTELFKAFSCD